VLKVGCCPRSEDLAQTLSWPRDRLYHDAEIASIVYRISTKGIQLMVPTPKAYHARHSRVMSSLSRLLGKFIFSFA
jgi:hypothetical protein